MRAKRILWFFLGAACFIISQPLLRMPLLQRLQQSTDFMLAYTLNPLAIGILIALSAGVFEEGFRFLFKQWIIRPAESEFSQPVIFGLGHGIAEAVMFLAPALAVMPVSQLGLGVLERILAIILHVTLTITVWNGFQRNRRVLYLLMAIAMHAFVNSLIPLLTSVPNHVILLEGTFAVIDVAMIGYARYSRRYYARRKVDHEEV